MKYTVVDIRNFYDDDIEVEAKSPLEAVKKAFPDYVVTRDYSNTGNIVVSGYSQRRYYGRGYRKYVYKTEKIEEGGG